MENNLDTVQNFNVSYNANVPVDTDVGTHVVMGEDDTPQPANQGAPQQQTVPTTGSVTANAFQQPVGGVQQTQTQQPAQSPVAPIQPASPTGDIAEQLFSKDGQFDHNSALKWLQDVAQPPQSTQPLAAAQIQPMGQSLSPIQEPVASTSVSRQEYEIHAEHQNLGLDVLESLLKEGLAPETALKYARNAIRATSEQAKTQYELEKRFDEKYGAKEKEYSLKAKDVELREKAVESQKKFYDNMAKLASKSKFPSIEAFQKVLVNVETGSGRFLGALFERMNPQYKNAPAEQFTKAMSNWMMDVLADPNISEALAEVAQAKTVMKTIAHRTRQAQIEQEKITKQSMQQPLPKSNVVYQQKQPVVEENKTNSFFGVRRQYSV